MDLMYTHIQGIPGKHMSSCVGSCFEIYVQNTNNTAAMGHLLV